MILPGLCLLAWGQNLPSEPTAPSFKDQEMRLKQQYGQRLYRQRKRHLELLKSIKYFIINGNLSQAQKALQQIDVSHQRLQEVVERYQALLFFIQGNWQQVLALLGQRRFQRGASFRKVCALKTMAQMAQGGEQWREWFVDCFGVKGNFARNGLLWPLLIRPYDGPEHPFELSQYPRGLEPTNFWLKLALYLGRAEEIVRQLEHIPLDAYRHQRTREVIGMALYREQKRGQALDFIEDIDLSNAHNIRGNIALSDGKYRAAKGHFRLALQKKENSVNAIKRLLPLSWFNQDFVRGLEVIDLAEGLWGSGVGADILRGVFLTELQKSEQAVELLLLLPSRERKLQARVLSELLAFNYLVLEKTPLATLAAHQSCQHFNGVSCYILGHLTDWDNFAGMLKREAGLAASSIDLEQLSGPIIKDHPFGRERVFIDQQIIEQLDALEQKSTQPK